MYAHTRCCAHCHTRLLYAMQQSGMVPLVSDRASWSPEELTSDERSEIQNAVERETAGSTLGMRPWIRTGFGRRAVAPTLVLFVATLVWWVGPTRRVDALRRDGTPPGVVARAARALSIEHGVMLPGFSAPDAGKNASADTEVDAEALRHPLEMLETRYERGRVERDELRWLTAGAIAQGRYDDATRFARSGQRHFDGASDFMALEAIVLWIRGDADRARALLERAEKLQPRDRVVQFDLGVMLAYEGNADRADTHFRRARSLSSNAVAGAFYPGSPR